MRGALILAVAGLLAAAPTAAQQSPSSPQHAAYTQAIRCFAANNHAAAQRRRASDAAGVARYEANARRSFDAAMALGTGLGLSNEQMNADLGTLIGSEFTRMAEDHAYFTQLVGTCRGLGLM